MTLGEQDELAAVAADLGLSRDRLHSVHADYVGTLIAVAHRDGIVTEREREDLDLVAETLGVGGLEQALRQLDRAESRESGDGGASAGTVGKSVCFTGALCCSYSGELITRELAERLAEEAGMVVLPRVTKKLDVLVVADPHSMSGKTRKAREYGTRIVAETAFWPMIGVEVS